MIYFEMCQKRVRNCKGETKDFLAIEGCNRDNDEWVQVVHIGKNSPTQDTVEVSVAYTTPWGKRLEQESMKSLKGSRPLFSDNCKMLWKTLKGTGVLLKNYRQIYKFKRKSINLVNVIIFILMLKI